MHHRRSTAWCTPHQTGGGSELHRRKDHLSVPRSSLSVPLKTSSKEDTVHHHHSNKHKVGMPVHLNKALGLGRMPHASTVAELVTLLVSAQLTRGKVAIAHQLKGQVNKGAKRTTGPVG